MPSVCRWWHLLLYSFGLVLMVVGSILYYIAPGIIHDMVQKEILLEKGKEIYENWKSPPVPIYSQFYVYTITNPDEFLSGEQVPKLKQLGPYTYREILKKEVLNDYDNGTVEYYQNKTFFFEADMSTGQESDFIFTLNTPVLSMVRLLEELNHPLISFAIGLIIEVVETTDDGKPLLRKSVGELLIKGYEMTFIDKIWSFLVNNLTMNEEFVNETISDLLPPEMANGIFGYYPFNNTNDGIYLVGTGRNGPEDFGDIKLWRGLPYHEKQPWGSDECNMINGTDGMIYRPFVDENSVLYAFIWEMCRSAHLTYEKKVEFRGIPGLRFVVGPDILGDPDVYPENQCFCVNGECLKAGVLDLTSCTGVSLVASLPHFYLGAEEYYNKSVLEGLEPMEEWHQCFIDIEPLTGLPLNGGKKFQVNFNLKPSEKYLSFANVSHMIFPIFWVNESAALTKELADEFYNRIILPQEVLAIGSWTAVGVGLLTVVVVGAITVREYRRRGFRPY